MYGFHISHMNGCTFGNLRDLGLCPKIIVGADRCTVQTGIHKLWNSACD